MIPRFNLEKNDHTSLRFRTSFIIESIVSSQRMITNFERQKRHWQIALCQHVQEEHYSLSIQSSEVGKSIKP